MAIVLGHFIMMITTNWVVFLSLNMPRLFLSRSLLAETEEEEEGAIKLVISIPKYFPIISTSDDFDKKSS